MLGQQWGKKECWQVRGWGRRDGGGGKGFEAWWHPAGRIAAEAGKCRACSDTSLPSVPHLSLRARECPAPTGPILLL